jgi:hypothetical protein
MASSPEAEVDVHEQKFAEDLIPLQIPVYLEGEESSFHTQNDPSQPFQRDVLVERRGPVDIRCEHKDIIHGFFSDAIEEPCSLIVLEFRFSTNRIARRIKEAHVVIQFSAMEKGKNDPEVVSIYPNGSFSVEPTKQHEILVSGGGLNVGGSFGAEIGGELKLEKTTERDTWGATRVRGYIDLRGRNWGARNSASWTFLENEIAKTGVVTSMQAAILVRRRDMDHFRSSVAIKVSADARTQFGSVFKSTPKDDEVWFDPARKPTNRLKTYDSDNLGTFDLKSVFDVTYQTVMKGATKEVNVP